MSFLQKEISLAKLDLLHLDIPQKAVFQSAVGKRVSREALIIRWEDEQGNVGYGECSARPDPYYSPEFVAGSKLCVQQFIFPFLQKKQTYQEVLKLLQRVRGWQFTKAAVEYAMHDLIDRRDGESLFDHWDRPAISHIPIGISMGLQPDQETFDQVVKDAREAGYRRLKFKIKPAMNWWGEALRDSTDYISFDANGTFQLADIPQLAAFVPFGNAIEQPFPPHRLDLYLAAKKQFPQLKVCLDEEVKSIGDLIKLHHLGAIDELNIKPGRMGGLYHSIQVADYCLQHGIPAWVGGMFESGIGRALNSRFAARLPEAQAHDLSPSARYFKKDIVVHPMQMNQEGFTSVAQAQDITVDEATIKQFLIEEISLTKN